VGLALAVVALIREAGRDGGAGLSNGTYGFLLGGVLVMYSGFLFAVLSVWWPLRPWLKRYQRARAWREWILHELPTLLALLPVLVTALKLLRSAWKDIKNQSESGDLGVAHLATVAKNFAEQAEELSRDPGVERIKRKIRESAS
jgi:hypothetical protein